MSLAFGIWNAAADAPDTDVEAPLPSWLDQATRNGHLMTGDPSRPAGVGPGFTRWSCQTCGAEAVMGLRGFVGRAFDEPCAGSAS